MAVAFLLINFAIGCVRPDSTCLEDYKYIYIVSCLESKFDVAPNGHVLFLELDGPKEVEHEALTTARANQKILCPIREE